MSQQTLPTTRIPPIGPLLARSLTISAAVTVLALIPVLSGNWRAYAAMFAQTPHWPNLALIAEAGPAVQAHLATLAGAIALTVFLLAGRKGARLHRILGWAWSALMLTTAIVAVFIQAPPGMPNIGGIGFLHLFSIGTLILLPLGLWRARFHDAAGHGRTMTGFVAGAFMAAGLFASLPGRLMWQVFFG